MSPKVISTELLENKDAKWINLVKIQYEDGHGRARTWEATRRSTRAAGSAVDGIQIVAVLRKATGPEILLEKQFRPPADRVVVEFPAGLVDPGETAAEAAVRELREETGYVGVVKDDGAGRPLVLWSSPASSSSCTHMIHVDIDLTKPENQNPVPELQDGEFIECFSVPLRNLLAECRKLEAQGFAIDGKVGAFAEGLEVARMMQS